MAESHRLNLTRLGWGLAVPVLFLVGVGLLTIHATDRESTSSAIGAAGADGSPPSLSWLDRVVQTIGPQTLKQSVFVVLGLVLMLVLLVPSYQLVGKYAWIIYSVAIALLGLLLIDRFVDLPLIPVVRDTRRWIEIGGFRLQPSEFMKPALIIVLARHLRFRKSQRTLRGLVVPFLITLLPMGLIHFQPDLGTLLMLLPVLLAMLFVAGARLRHLGALALLGVAAAPLFYVYGMKSYQRQRFDVVLKQNVADERWHMGPGYQLRQAKIALGTGGVWGEGTAQGLFVEHSLLPEEHNDFIFAMVGHQWGLAGELLLLAAYAIIVLCGFEVATVTNDPFGRLLAVGVVVMISTQALLNIGMSVGAFPITGITLPFVSAGGSSLLANFAALALLVNVAQRRPMLIARKPFADEQD